jgi:hypothetical protein
MISPERTLGAGKNRLTLHGESSSLLSAQFVGNFYSSNFERKKSTGKIPFPAPFSLTERGLYINLETALVSI